MLFKYLKHDYEIYQLYLKIISMIYFFYNSFQNVLFKKKKKNYSREVQEECGLTPTNLRRIGLLEFEFEADVNVMEVHVFETYTYHGQLTETEGN